MQLKCLLFFACLLFITHWNVSTLNTSRGRYLGFLKFWSIFSQKQGKRQKHHTLCKHPILFSWKSTVFVPIELDWVELSVLAGWVTQKDIGGRIFLCLCPLLLESRQKSQRNRQIFVRRYSKLKQLSVIRFVFIVYGWIACLVTRIPKCMKFCG